MLDSPSSPSWQGSDSEDDISPPLNEEHGVKPIFSPTLRFLTKQFKTPFNIQYVGSEDDKLIFSDGVSSISADVGGYSSIFSSIELNTVITVFVCTRERVSPFNLQFRNLRVAPKHCQCNVRIGNPVPF